VFKQLGHLNERADTGEIWRHQMNPLLSQLSCRMRPVCSNADALFDIWQQHIEVSHFWVSKFNVLA